jgi:hypothetical protein
MPARGGGQSGHGSAGLIGGCGSDHTATARLGVGWIDIRYCVSVSVDLARLESRLQSRCLSRRGWVMRCALGCGFVMEKLDRRHCPRGARAKGRARSWALPMAACVAGVRGAAAARAALGEMRIVNVPVNADRYTVARRRKGSDQPGRLGGGMRQHHKKSRTAPAAGKSHAIQPARALESFGGIFVCRAKRASPWLFTSQIPHRAIVGPGCGTPGREQARSVAVAARGGRQSLRSCQRPSG